MNEAEKKQNQAPDKLPSQPSAEIRAAVAELGIDESNDLMEGFSMEALLGPSNAAYVQINSADKEVSGVEDNKRYYPEAIKGVPEAETIYRLIMQPSTDLKQIKQRQALVDSMIGIENLDEIVGLKNEAYNIKTGINGLFATISINDYETAIAIESFRNGRLPKAMHGYIYQQIELIEQGARALNQLIEIFEGMQDPFIRKAMLETLKESRDLIQKFDKKYFMEADIEEIMDRESVACAEKCQKRLIMSAVFIEFARIVLAEEYGRASFDKSKPHSYRGAHCFARKKEGQVLTQSDTGQDSQIRLYSGPNNSGKSYSGLKTAYFAQKLAQSFGHGPFQELNSPVVFDSFHYLDRSSTDHKNNLSAFGAEMEELNNMLDNLGENPFICMDESGSTTDRKGAYQLNRATLLFLKGKGAKIQIASHNEDLIRWAHEQDQDIRVYHFPATFQAGASEPKYSRKLTDGPGESHAIEVARSHGLPEKILEVAQQFLDGNYVKATLPELKPIPVESYTEEERAKMKKGSKSIVSIVPTPIENPRDQFMSNRHWGRKPETLSHMLSDDSDFKLCLRDEGGFINDFLFKSPSISTKDTLERQRMFDQIIARDEIGKMKQIAAGIKAVASLAAGYGVAGRDAMIFNIALNPFNRSDITLSGVEGLIIYLEFNQKLLGDKFPFDKELDELKRAKELRDKIEEMKKERDIDEVLIFLHGKITGPITDPATLEMFFKLSSEDEQPAENRGVGEVTTERVLSYLKWLQVNKDQKRYDHDVYRLKDMLRRHQEDVQFDRILERMEELARHKKTFNRIAAEIGEDSPEKWGDKITVPRIEALMAKIRGMGYEEDRWQKLEKLDEMQGDLHYGQRYIKVDGHNIDTLKSRVINLGNYVTAKHADKPQRKIPEVSLFDTNIEAIKPELLKLLDVWDEIFGGTGYDSFYTPDNDGYLFPMVLRRLLDTRDYPKEFLDHMRSYDSVDLHQVASSLEDQFVDYLFGEDVSQSPLMPEGTIAHGPSIIAGLKKIFEETRGEEYKDLIALEEEWREICDRHAYVYYEKLHEAKELYEGYQKWRRGELMSDDREVRDFMNELATYRGVGLKDSLNSFPEYKERMGWRSNEDPEEVWRDFMQKELMGGPEIQAIQAYFDDMQVLGQKAMNFAAKHGISGLDEALKKGNVRPLRHVIQEKYSRHIDEMFQDWHARERRYLIAGSVERIMALFKIGEMAKEQKQSRINLSGKGEFSLPNAWSMLMPKDQQVKNDIGLKPGERCRILGGPNMSGKTVNLKASQVALCWALQTGRAPTEGEATIPAVSNVIYFDRVTAKDNINMGSFLNEVWRCLEQIKVMERSGEKAMITMSNIDEAWSTTSPGYRNALVYAFVHYALERGHLVTIAGHTHEAFKALANEHPGTANIYHFGWHFEDDPSKPSGKKIKLDHDLREGHEDSKAIDVAEALGLNSEIVELARLIS